MRLYIKSKFTKQLSFGYEELAHKMWFKERKGQAIELSHTGNDEMLQKEYYIRLTWAKWLNDCRWRIEELHSCWNTEALNLEFEDEYISDYREK